VADISSASEVTTLWRYTNMFIIIIIIIKKDSYAIYHYVSAESCCTVVVKQCMEIYRNIQVLLF